MVSNSKTFLFVLCFEAMLDWCSGLTPDSPLRNLLVVLREPYEVLEIYLSHQGKASALPAILLLLRSFQLSIKVIVNKVVMDELE